jgi:16S rRNA (adenine1518-N6/adenine1519-N6)-dimethyltransferase
LDALGIERGCSVWEVGPGLGAMTWGLLERGAKVTAFEIDHGFCEVLREFFTSGATGNFTLVEGDVLKTFPAIAGTSGDFEDDAVLPYFLSNLPYNIAQLLMVSFIEKNVFFRRMVITVQKEVAARFFAKPCSKNYSPCSVLHSLIYNIKPLPVLKGSAFYPVPKIDSRPVLFELKSDRYSECAKLPENFSSLVHALFASRRKTIQNNLASFIGGDNASAQALAILNSVGINQSERAENIAPSAFLKLSHCVGAYPFGLDNEGGCARR